MFKTTLDQWFVFKTIVQQKGYSAAAEYLNRSQSTISYSMAKLQSQMGLQLVQMEGKHCVVTASGKRLLEMAQSILSDFEYLEQVANGISNGIEAQIKLSMDNIFPKDVLFQAITQFSEKFPATEVVVDEHIRLLFSDTQNYDLRIATSEDGLIPGPKLLEVRLLPVAHKEHPIFQSEQSSYVLSDLSKYKQIFYKRSFVDDDDSENSVPRRIWSVHSVESAVSAVKANLCFGCLPWHSIKELVESGIVRQIPVEPKLEIDIPLYLVEKNSLAQGPATQYLAQMIKDAASEYQAH
ncbi:LysR family transcriptional regulator [Celerinatantimonas sp. YJH-8]|uniref:LysR family transcriptional regulator n=1 Tax=Celerinatantimonas sp. YJH-8 TaxID=3228714 RepID=UPI0038CB4E6A